MARGFPNRGMNPLQFWMQFAEQWQKASADAMAFWAKASKSDTVGLRRADRATQNVMGLLLMRESDTITR